MTVNSRARFFSFVYELDQVRGPRDRLKACETFSYSVLDCYNDFFAGSAVISTFLFVIKEAIVFIATLNRTSCPSSLSNGGVLLGLNEVAMFLHIFVVNFLKNENKTRLSSLYLSHICRQNLI